MVELSEIFRNYSNSYLGRYSDHILPSHRKAIADIIKCRSPVMGGKVYLCDECKEYHYSYYSCGNRNCNKCQNDLADKWFEKNSELLLPANYFMITFTLPGLLRKLARSNQKLFYNLLFSCSSKTIYKLSLDYIGGLPGMIGIIHTWARNLAYHPHVHYIVTGGGLLNDKSRWVKSSGKFLFPVKALSIIFKAKFRDELKKANPLLFYQVPSKVWRDDWVVNSIPVGTGNAALKYLAPYVFRPAISNNRILKLENGKVTFKYKESKTKLWKTITLLAEEFMRCYLQHVLPKSFVKVRYYGLFASKNKMMLHKANNILSGNSVKTKIKCEPKKTKSFKCPVCGKDMTLFMIIPRGTSYSNKAPPVYPSAGIMVL
ncbi:MAG: transposase [Ignavibacteriales bacterium]|nr:transposase [Ignavibacteriales bacterium]